MTTCEITETHNGSKIDVVVGQQITITLAGCPVHSLGIKVVAGSFGTPNDPAFQAATIRPQGRTDYSKTLTHLQPIQND